MIEVPVDITNPHVLFRIEGALQQKIQAEAKAAIEEAQKTKTDIFGFGEKLHHSEPRCGNSLKKSGKMCIFLHWTSM